MIRFAHPEYLYWLALVPLMIFFYWSVGRRRRAAKEKFSSPQMLVRLASESSGSKRVAKSVLLLSAVSFLVIGLADPSGRNPA